MPKAPFVRHLSERPFRTLSRVHSLDLQPLAVICPSSSKPSNTYMVSIAVQVHVLCLLSILVCLRENLVPSLSFLIAQSFTFLGLGMTQQPQALRCITIAGRRAHYAQYLLYRESFNIRARPQKLGTGNVQSSNLSCV